MPLIRAQGKTIECEIGANLRQVLLSNGVDVYNNAAKTINCHGLGTCGTCAVEVQGAVSEMNRREKTRLSLPPHSPARGRRLSCQTQVLGDVSVTKFDGFWGQGDRPVWTAESSGQFRD
ncbi:MAG: (2Fe-2S)-binding protein [Leptolyngbyaceae cyanobacterium HOT.MB2.61]|nr:(2Fe-2S)-binding protein [Leptolyngbyaceae cyanobacterium HOT.MB2.61]